jgi:hypothetical protein
MESKVKRTLVKSAPELWELADDIDRMQAWMAGVVGSAEPVAVEVVERDPERILAWRASRGGADHVGIEIEMAESGFGTAVSITAQHPGATEEVDATLESVLDELGSPERRPFTRA